jgi:hypothetical protein
MKGAYNVGGPQGTHNLKGAHETRDIYLRIINMKLKAFIHHSCPINPLI